MPMIDDLDPSPFFLEGGNTGILLIHGFTGAPTEMRLLGEYLNNHGYTVSAPLLPGHGTTAEDLNNYGWADWYDHIKNALYDLRGRCETNFVAGLSMGALLTLTLAAKEKDIKAIATYAPPLKIKDFRRNLPPILARLVHQLPKSRSHWFDPEAELLNWSYETFPSKASLSLVHQIPKVIELLPRIECPLLAIYTPVDKQVDPEGLQILLENVGTSDTELVEMAQSGHVLTLDKCWQDVAALSYNFFARRCSSDLAEATSEIVNK